MQPADPTGNVDPASPAFKTPAEPAKPTSSAEDTFSDAVLDAAQSRDLPRLEAASEVLRSHYPAAAEGYRPVVREVMAAGRLTDAGAILASAQTYFATDEWFLESATLLAERQGDWSDAILWAKNLREHAPSNSIGYQTAITALTQTGRAEEARSVLDTALTALRSEPWPLVKAVEWAQQADQPTEVITQAANLRERFPLNPVGWLAGTNALMRLGRLDEAEAVLSQAETRFSGTQWWLTFATNLAIQRRQFQRAGEYAERLVSGYPWEPTGYRVGLQSYREQRRLDEARLLLERCTTLLPNATWLRSEKVALAAVSGDQETELALRAELLAEQPDRPILYRGYAEALIANDRLDAAEMVLGRAVERFPTAVWAHVMHAELAERRGEVSEARQRWLQAAQVGPSAKAAMLQYALAPTRIADGPDWSAALKRLEMVTDSFPDFWQAWAVRVRTLRAAGEGDAAEHLCLDCLQRFRGSVEIWLEHGRNAVVRRDHAEAARRFELGIESLPEEVELQRELAIALGRLGQHDEAEQVISSAINRFGHSDRLVKTSAILTTFRGNKTQSSTKTSVVRESVTNISTK